MSEEIKKELNRLGSKNPYLSETELEKIFRGKFNRSPLKKEIRLLRLIQEDYRTR